MATEDISTIRSSGGDYTTLSAWEAGEQTNLVTADKIAVAECYDDWPSGLDNSVSIAGWTTDATRYIVVRPASGHRHNGTPQSGFFMKRNSGFGTAILAIGQQYTRVIGIDIENTASSDAKCFEVTASNCQIDGCIGKSTSGNPAFRLTSGVVVTNSLAVGPGQGFVVPSFASATVYNSTAAGCSTGFLSGSSATFLARNCVAYNCTTNWSGTFSGSSSHNATSTGSDDAPGADSVISVGSGAFVDAAGGNYHLASGSALIGVGVNLYSTFVNDVDGDTRPSSGPWDIGFDHRVSSGSSGNATVAVGYAVRSAGSATVAAGYAVRSAGSAAVAVGYAVRASGSATVAAGYAVRSAGSATVATGYAVRTASHAAVAVGYAVDSAAGVGSATVAVGYAVRSAGASSVAVGYAVRAAGSWAVGAGYAVRSAGLSAVPVGYAVRAGGFVTASVGYAVTAVGAGSVAIGYAVTPQAGGEVWPDPATVLAGIQYGPSGADYIGTLSMPGTSAIAAAVWAYVQRGLTERVDADVQAVNGVELQGSGVDSDPMRPA